MYGNVRVAMEDLTVLVDYTVRKFCVQHVSNVTCPSTLSKFDPVATLP